MDPTKMSESPENRPSTIKGVRVSEIVALSERGHGHGFIQRRYPQLTWAEIDDIVNADRYEPVRRALAEGRPLAEVAKSDYFKRTRANVWGIKRTLERNERLKRDWGGLSPRAVTFLKRRGYATLAEFQKQPPAGEEEFMAMKGVGLYLLTEIKTVVPLKRREPPAEARSRPPAPRSPRARPTAAASTRPFVYVTKAAHYREALESPTAPEHAKQLARFFDAIVKFAPMVPHDELLPSDIPCMAGPGPRRWCLGVVGVSWTKDALGVWWECPVCDKQGVVTESGAIPASPVSESRGPLH